MRGTISVDLQRGERSVERAKTFTVVEKIIMHEMDDGFDSRHAEKIDLQLTDRFDEWLKKNPEFEVIETSLETNFGIIQASTTFSHGHVEGWITYCLTLFVRYTIKKNL